MVLKLGLVSVGLVMDQFLLPLISLLLSLSLLPSSSPSLSLPLLLLSLSLPLPPFLLSSLRTGCKPFVEVFQNSERLYTSASQDNMEQIKSFAASEDRVVEIPLNVMVNGNMIVVVHHIRAIPANKMSGMVSGGMYMLCLLLWEYQR